MGFLRFDSGRGERIYSHAFQIFEIGFEISNNFLEILFHLTFLQVLSLQNEPLPAGREAIYSSTIIDSSILFRFHCQEAQLIGQDKNYIDK
jgi:hypothetical protein